MKRTEVRTVLFSAGHCLYSICNVKLSKGYVVEREALHRQFGTGLQKIHIKLILFICSSLVMENDLM